MKPRSAFTLLEVLLAIGIFVIGFVAVASMFPVAAMLQKETVRDVEQQQFGRSVKSLIDAIATDAKLAAAPISAVNDGTVFDVSSIVSAEDRAYPSKRFPTDTTPKRGYTQIFARYNVPASTWVFYSFMLTPQNGAAPTVASYPVTIAFVGSGQSTFQDTSNTISVAPGDMFMDNEGQTFTVFDFDATTHTIKVDTIPAVPSTTIWAAPAKLCKRISVTKR